MRIAKQIGRESLTVDYAGVWLRSVAMIIDGAILGVLSWLFNGAWSIPFGIGWMGGQASEDLSYGEVGAVYWIVGLLVPFLMIMAYFIGFWGWRGQTVGMMIMRLRVVRFAGEKVTWGTAVMRFLGMIIAVIPLFIGLLWIPIDARRQGLHDKIAETFVVRIEKGMAGAPGSAS